MSQIIRGRERGLVLLLDPVLRNGAAETRRGGGAAHTVAEAAGWDTVVGGAICAGGAATPREGGGAARPEKRGEAGVDDRAQAEEGRGACTEVMGLNAGRGSEEEAGSGAAAGQDVLGAAEPVTLGARDGAWSSEPFMMAAATATR